MDNLFISHVHTEGDLAQRIGYWLEQAVPGAAGFVSSDPSEIPAGRNWLNHLEEALRKTRVFILLCSPESIERPWVNFEAGCAYINRQTIIPVCHSGLRPDNLPLPISQFEAVDISRGPEACRKLVRSVAQLYEVEPRAVDYDRMARELSTSQRDAVTTPAGIGMHSRAPRVAVHGASTDEIERNNQKKKALRRFYLEFLKSIERTGLAINCCGAEPLRSVFFERYCERLFASDRTQLVELNWRVRFYWHPADVEGFNHAPAFFDHQQTLDAFDRDRKEIEASQVIVAWTGRSGTLAQARRILGYHKNREYGIDLEQKPFVLLGWFGGSIAQLLRQEGASLRWLTDRYAELNPFDEVKDWERNDTVIDLARRLVATLHRLATA